MSTTDTDPRSSRMTLIEVLVLVACTAIGLWLGSRGFVIDLGGRGQPSYWPFLGWSRYLLAPAIVTAPVLLLIDFLLLGRKDGLRPGELFWLVSALCWWAIYIPLLGFIVALLLLFLQHALTILGILLCGLFPARRNRRPKLRWTDALGVFYLVILSINAVIMGDAFVRI